MSEVWLSFALIIWNDWIRDDMKVHRELASDAAVDTHRRKTFQMVLAIMIFIGAFYIGLGLYRGVLWLVFAHLSFVSFCAVLLFQSPDKRRLRIQSFLFLAVYYALVIFSINRAEPHSVSFLWLAVGPPLSYLLLGRKTGFWVNAVFITVGVLSYQLMLMLPESSISRVSMFNLVFCLLTIWAIADVYEAQRENVEKRLRDIAMTDPLTGLCNRLSLAAEYQDIVEKSGDKPVSLILLDLDYFKQVNDRYGHEVGDLALIHVANVIKMNVSEREKIFRIGGEEFCITSEGSGKYEAKRIAEHIRCVISHTTFHHEQQVIPLSASIGISSAGDDGNEFATLYRKADRRMYHAKKTGRNRVVDSDPLMTSAVSSG
ncbi:GGDEF domain-containing protein [Thaumasiovibrio subtropicus]|uniref:GGDEF domain-containing protein n=1 Tax=Thaumasiovibrio subtropicus TaxID=1891207 RepID=UPI000B362E48|nr:GGDEF domain-containing protein [Thaumasiovibrio subtropicus]